MCSTPHGKQGYFWEAYQNKDNRYKVIHTSSEEVIKTRPLSNDWTQTQREAAIRFLEGEKSDMSQLQYGQEYLGLFLDDLQRYFPDKLIDKCCTAKVPPSITHQRPYYLGVDIARMGDDESTFEIIKFYHKESLIHVQSQITRKTRTTDTEQRILELNRLYNFKKIYIDAGAGTLGVSVFDHLLAHPETKRKVVAINNAKRMVDRFNELKTRLLKEDLYDNLRSLMEKGWIQLLDDEKVRLSLRSVQFEFIQKPNSNSQMRIFGDYTHIVEGLIRAAWCAKEKQINTGITYI